jgi:hypothetical protein
MAVRSAKKSGIFPIIFAGFPISEICFPNYLSVSESSKMPVPQGFSAFSSFAAAICAVFPLFFPFLRERSQRLVRITLREQPVSLPFGDCLFETREIPANWALLPLPRSLRMAEFRVLAPRIPKCLSLLPRGLPFSRVSLRRPKNKPTARGGNQSRGSICCRCGPLVAL